MNHSPPGSSVHGVSQARLLEWLPFPPPGDLPAPGVELVPAPWQADCLPLSLQGSPGSVARIHIFPTSAITGCSVELPVLNDRLLLVTVLYMPVCMCQSRPHDLPFPSPPT